MWKSKRTSDAGASRFQFIASAATAINRSAPSAGASHRMLRRERAPGVATPASPFAACSARRTSRMSCQRASGSLSRQPRITRSTAGDTPGASAGSGAGSDDTIAPMIDAVVSPSNGRRPAIIS